MKKEHKEAIIEAVAPLGYDRGGAVIMAIEMAERIFNTGKGASTNLKVEDIAEWARVEYGERLFNFMKDSGKSA